MLTVAAAHRAKSLRSFAQLFQFLGWFVLVLCVIGVLAEIQEGEPNGSVTLAFLVGGVAALLNGLWFAALSSGLAELLDPTQEG